MLNYLWLIPLLPVLGAAVNGISGLVSIRLTGRRTPKNFVATIGVGVVVLSFAISVVSVLALLALPAEERLFEKDYFTWIPGLEVQTLEGIRNFTIYWGFQLDPLSAVMILVVTGVGLLIHIYSVGYMWDDDGFYRFFTYLNLFMAAMLTLVLANNYLVMFVGWEGVGLCSYLLIGFYVDKKSAGDAGKKAFIVNRVGDFGFALGMMLLFTTVGSLDYTTAFETIAGRYTAPEVGFGVLTTIALLLFVGATGKSAQIPLYVWLPDAMEGPTPVSALIHAATMVTAGVYMVARSAAIYTRAPKAMAAVAAIGIVTALVAATIGLVQKDIKRVLAYSTVSQLGYMFTALGVGAFGAGIFHLFTHAFFKALLFLGSGSVIHAAHEQDMTRMGGLKKYMPWTFRTMMIGTLAIAGVPFLAGFFSKDEILWKAFSSPHGHPAIYLIGLTVAGFTTFYMFRLMFLTFFGRERFAGGQAPGSRLQVPAGSHAAHAGHDDHGHHGVPHESPTLMIAPLMILAFFAAVVGFLGVPPWMHHYLPFLPQDTFGHFLKPAFRYNYAPAEEAPHGEALELGLALLSVLVAGAGILLAYTIYLKREGLADRLAARFRGVYNLLFNKYYVDEVYDAVIVHRAKDLGTGLWKFDDKVVDGAVNGSAAVTVLTSWISGGVDVHIVDRLVNLIGQTVQLLSRTFRKIQTGLVQRYALFFVGGLVLFISLYLFWER